jgi:hypothetical protein
VAAYGSAPAPDTTFRLPKIKGAALAGCPQRIPAERGGGGSDGCCDATTISFSMRCSKTVFAASQGHGLGKISVFSERYRHVGILPERKSCILLDSHLLRRNYARRVVATPAGFFWGSVLGTARAAVRSHRRSGYSQVHGMRRTPLHAALFRMPNLRSRRRTEATVWHCVSLDSPRGTRSCAFPALRLPPPAHHMNTIFVDELDERPR